MKNGKLNKAEQIMQNYRKSVKEIDSQYENIEENNNKCIYVNDVKQILSNSMIEFVSYLCFF